MPVTRGSSATDSDTHSARTAIAHQNFVHVPWEWAFVGLLHSSIHGIPLRFGCPSCGEMDPPPFGLTPEADSVRLPVLLCEPVGRP
jgi:hypothetical protein